MARSLTPELILLDIDMPEMDGFGVLQQLKDDAATQDIPVIFLSGEGRTELKVRGFEMGAIDFVTKPFEMAELRARVRSALRMRLLIKMLAQRAQIDGQTGLWNRVYLDARLQQAIAEARRGGTPLGLIMCDLDYFKRINDTYGHPFGDQVLEETARLLTRGRAGDVACRYGGEEFAIITSHANATEARNIAERLRIALRAVRWEGYPDLVVTASFGVTDLDRVSEATARAMIESADQAMYQAKQGGRDSVATAPDTLRLTA